MDQMPEVKKYQNQTNLGIYKCFSPRLASCQVLKTKISKSNSTSSK